ncbi:hypothetical protein [Flavobacterium sp.]|uniref:hypothetical protein n=1 Tax=Flavobacterium sp. TaxID=239 RepID=UPI003D6B8ADA
MDNTITIKNILGLTQEEMGMVLGISISQWKMYKSGKRDIPLSAKEHLTALLRETQNKNQIAEETKQFIKVEQQKAKEKLQQECLKIEIRLHRLEREISNLNNQRSECFAALEVVALLESHKIKSVDTLLASCIKSRALKTLNNHSLFKMEQMQLQKESLEILKAKIKKRLKS